MNSAFAQPSCAATYHTSPTTRPSVIPAGQSLPQVRNDALVYLAVAVAGFAAVPTLFWFREKRNKEKERRRNRAMVESLRTKMDATKSVAVKGLETKGPALAVVPVVPETSIVEDYDMQDMDETKEKKKRSKERRKRGRDREPSRGVRDKKSASSLGPCPISENRCDLSPKDDTPRALEQPHLSEEHIESQAPSSVPPSMPELASPTPLSLISNSFRPSSSQSQSETSSQPGQSRSLSASPTTAPTTPPPLSASDSLPSLPTLVSVNSQETDSWVFQLSHIPRDDPAWDWDGQSSTYSAGSPARALSSSSSQPQLPSSKRFDYVNKTPPSRPTNSSPESPTESTLPSAPSLVFPSLNAHPPPGASLTTQIASLKGALEASRTREEKHRRDAEHWSKECDLVKWRWNEAADMWRRHEAELLSQIRHLVLQLQTLNHTLQAASISPTISFIPTAGQPSFPFFPSHHGSPLGMSSANAPLDMVNENLADAILKRPGSIKTSASDSCRNGLGPTAPKINTIGEEKQKLDNQDEIIEFEFPTLSRYPVSFARADMNGESQQDTHSEVEVFT